MLQPSPTMMHNIYGSMAMARHTIAQYEDVSLFIIAVNVTAQSNHKLPVNPIVQMPFNEQSRKRVGV